jgi:hypothetical protein
MNIRDTAAEDLGLQNYEVPIFFTKDCKIDQTVDTRDMSRPFYFFLHQPDAVSGKVSSRGFTVDIGTRFRVWLDENVPPGSDTHDARSLAIQIHSDQDINVKDKVLFDAIPFGSKQNIDLRSADTTRYFSFSFMIDPSYETPKGWLLHLQAWQCCGGHPPFAINVTPNQDKNSPIEFTFDVDDDISDAGTNPVKPIYKMPVQRGEWYTMTLKLQPRADDAIEPGEVQMWLNGESKFVYRGHWGFIPRDNGEGKGLRTSAIGIDVGVYRRRQTTTQTIYFDDIRYGDTLAAVVGRIRP